MFVETHLARPHCRRGTAGNEGTGKSSLVARLQGKKYDPRDHPMGTGLEYSYLEVSDDDTEGGLNRHDSATSCNTAGTWAAE